MSPFYHFWALFLLSSMPLIAQTTWFQNGQNADLMISGVGFNDAGGALTFNHPNGLATDGTRLLVCDRFNNRILVWNTPPTAWNDAPDLVLGQINFTDNNPGINKDKLNWVGNASVAANGTLAVADTDNDRILIWNTFPTFNGQAANTSIHLPTLTPAGSVQQWGWPWGVWTDGTRLVAVATSGKTLLFWNNLPTADNTPPDYTISLATMGTPRNISTDGSTYFFVGDHNATVTGMPGTFFWNSYPTNTNQPYDFYRNEWIKGTKLTSGKLAASGLMNIYTWNTMPTTATQNPDIVATPAYYKNGDGVDLVEINNRIYVNNYNGNDVLVYDQTPANGINPLFALGVANHTHNTLDSIGYVQNPAIAIHNNRLILTSDFDRRLYIYNNLPTQSGVMPDTVVSLQPYNFSPWDNACYNGKFVAAGGNRVLVWNNANALTLPPNQTFNGNIGTAVLSDIKGVALDAQFFYLADRNGMIYIWAGIPANVSVNPLYTINVASGGGTLTNRLSSDGTYFCIARQSPATVFVHRVADIAAGNLTPWKTINTPGLLNLPAEATTYNGALAIANNSFNSVLLWQDINQAGNTASVVALGQSSWQEHQPAIGQNRLFMPSAVCFHDNQLWVGEFKFSSRVLRFTTDACVPPAPFITGSTIACNSHLHTYSTPLVAGHTYAWTVMGGTIVSGQNTNQIVVQWSGGVAGLVSVQEGD